MTAMHPRSLLPSTSSGASGRAVGVLAVVVAALTGCGGAGGVPPSASPPPAADVPTSLAPPTRTAIPSSAAATMAIANSAVVPAALVGDWSSAEGNAEIVYRFLADGQFRSAQILNQPRAGGVFEFRIVQQGTVQVTGDRLVLRPTSSLKSLTDPDDPRRSYTDQPASLEAESYTWQVTGSTLRLRGADGLVLTFARQ